MKLHSNLPSLTTRTYSRPLQLGLSLVELMIALTIGLLLVVGVAQIFVTSRATYTMEEGLARTQEAGRFAMEFLTRDIRVAGYMGCNSTMKEGTYDSTKNACYGASKTICTLVKNPDEISTFKDEGIRGFHYTGSGGTNATDWTPSLPPTYGLAGAVRPYTDVIVLQRASDFTAQLTGSPDPTDANIQVLSGSSMDGVVQAGSILMISDCKGGDVFKATSVSNGAGKVTIAHASNLNINPKLTHKYKDGADISMLMTQIYYAGTGSDGEPSLMMKQTSSNGTLGAAQEVVPGIEYMRILYGEDSDFDPAIPNSGDKVANIYRTAANVNSSRWEAIVSVRVGFLIRTNSKVESVVDTRQFEIVDGITIDPPDDKRRRQMYQSTIQLRN